MESVLIWSIMIAVIIGILVPYYVKFRRRQKFDLQRKKEAENLGINKPSGQYPLIDASLCIGCGACVDACPEGDVLGVVFGKATIINGQRCVGHGYCADACPVMGIKVGLGDIKSRPDIPLLDDDFQTTVPGIYVAGELGGLSLIRNAIDQGKTIVQKIAADAIRSPDLATFDVIIVGAGPAGLTAALSAIENKLSYVVFDQQEPGGTVLQYPRRKLVMTQPVEIPLYGKLKNDEYAKEELLEIWKKIIADFKINIRVGEKVEKVIKDNGNFRVYSQSGAYSANRIILAMGRRGTPRKLGVAGEDLPKVLFQLVDAQSYENLNLLVVGGGDSAIEAAVGLARQKSNKVTVSYRKSTFARVKKKNEERVNELIAAKKIRPLFNSQVLEIKNDTVKLKVDQDILEMPNDYVFVFIGGEPPFKMLQEMGIAFGGEAKSLELSAR